MTDCGIGVNIDPVLIRRPDDMNPQTRRIHNNAAALGKLLGFRAEQEVSTSLLSLRLYDAYHPRIDLLWSLPLSVAQRRAIAWALGVDDAATERIKHLPVVGLEIEGTQPTTKTLEADIANLAALGAPLGLLVVSESGEKGIYRRAARAIRTTRRAFGDISVLPVEASWLEEFMSKDWPSGKLLPPMSSKKAPAGGESRQWSPATRRVLRQKGKEAGFVVAESWNPPIVKAAFELQRAKTGELAHTTDPKVGERSPMRKAGDYLTNSEIDLAWLAPLPGRLRAFLEKLDTLDPYSREHGLSFSELWNHIPVVAFELESGRGKHAGGALLNLAAYSVIGVLGTETDRAAEALKRTLRTYQPALGLRNVFVRQMP